MQDKAISGGVTINDVMMQAGVPNAPFGGVGESGMGFYHGKYGFLAFTHLRTVVEPPTWLESVMSMRYPAYDTKHKSKIAVKNRLGFRRGETMSDQRAKTSRGLGRVFLRVAFVAGLAGCILYWADEIRAAKMLLLVMTRRLL